MKKKNSLKIELKESYIYIYYNWITDLFVPWRKRAVYDGDN